MADLQTDIERFVQTWGPDQDQTSLRHAFIEKLRELMNAYAESALKHGNLPETGSPHTERGQELEAENDFIQLSRACDFLEHYHISHTDDMVTRFRGKGDRPDIYIVGDVEWKQKLREFVTPIFLERESSGKAKHRRRN